MTPLHLLFPKIMPRLISLQAKNLVLPFAIFQTVTSAYLTTLREVMR